MRITLEYFRQFFPLYKEDILRSKYGNPYVSNDYTTNEELEVEEFLEKINIKYGIPYRIRLISNEYYKEQYPEYPIELPWSEDIVKEFLPSAQQIKMRKRRGFEEDFYDIRKKRHHFAFTLLVKVDGKIEWYEVYYQYVIPFLAYLNEEGITPIVNMLETKEWPPWDSAFIPHDMEFKGTSVYENSLLLRLIESGILGKFLPKPGNPDTEVVVGRDVYYGTHLYWYTGAGRKRIDMVYETMNEIWIIEAKYLLDWSAIGQVLGYKTLYNDKRRQLPEKERKKPIKLAIVCQYTDPEIERCCHELGILLLKSIDLKSRMKNIII